MKGREEVGKMPTSRAGLRVLGAAAIILSLAACSGVAGKDRGAGGSQELVMQSYTSRTVSYGVAMDAWMEEVTEATDSSLTFNANYDGSLYTVTEILEAVSDGRLDVGHFSVSYPNQFPLTVSPPFPSSPTTFRPRWPR